MDQDPDFKHKLSSASCNVDDVSGMVFGGAQSRFWMLRKHFNSLSVKKLHKAPFLSWQCLTLYLPTRDINLVIKNDTHMSYLLKFLIYHLKTVNGNRDSAV